MKEKPLCGYCYNECTDECCDKRRIDVLERQLDQKREDMESYKYDLETLIAVLNDCVNKMSSEECYDTLKQVADHYKQLKEQGDESL